MIRHTVENSEMGAAIKDLGDWLIGQGIEGTAFETLLEQCCSRIIAAGIPLQRAHITMRAHHPEIAGIAFRWHREDGNEKMHFANSPEQSTDWLQSPLHYLLSNDISEMRQRLSDPDPAYEFPVFADLRARGGTDYFAAKRFFRKSEGSLAVDLATMGEGMLISLVADAPGGFSDAELDALRSLLPALSLTLKCGATRNLAENITAAYMGRDASRRVLSGDIMRGSSETISAVIWYFDLKDFTRLSETYPGPVIIDLLNEYFAIAVDIVEARGGNVLKFMGDGMLAIFDLNDIPDARLIAVEAAVELRGAFAELNEGRTKEGLPVTNFTLALHEGDVLYGNIGGRNRLDFTVIGPAVNTTARILGMCSAVDQSIIISSAVAKPAVSKRSDLVSLGQYRLRGITDRQELFTLD